MNTYKSFLQARDPSILAFNRPPINSEQKMDLYSEFTDSSIGSEDSVFEDLNLQVYLRIKPTKDLKDLYDIDENILVCRIPPGSQALRNFQDGSKLKKQFTFSKIYGPEIQQTEIFNDCIKKKVLQFINGKNCTIFTYGTSGSGKTFTILGTTENPGIIPRSLEYIFRSLPDVKDVPSMKPTPAGDLRSLNTSDRKNEIHARNLILQGTTVIDKSEHINTYKLMQQRLSTESAAVLGNTGVFIGLWVSFAEIYNEYVYDLLVPEIAKGNQRPKLRLAQDSKGNTYVKDLKNISVSSGLEAYEILQYGMQNLNYASTNVNSHSSRSHCIFTIKLVQWVSETEVLISHLNFCDLAGSERVKNTRNVGDRLKESNNINSSLLVLGRCIESIRKNQKSNDSRLVPFRDSKLTRLFQRALSGYESLTMIVNINTTREMFDESQHVLNFSAIAREIIMEKEVKPEKHNTKKRFSQYIQGRSTALPNISEAEPTERDILLEKIQTLTFDLNMRDQLWSEKERQIRRQITDVFRERDEEYRKKTERRTEDEKLSLMKTFEKKMDQMETHYKKLLSRNEQNPKRMRCASVIDLSDDDESELEDIKHLLKIKSIELEQFQQRVKESSEQNSLLQKELTQYKFENTALMLELKNEKERGNKMAEELSSLRQSDIRKDEIINDAKEEIAEIETEKKKLEIELENKCIENLNLNKKINDLNDELSAHIEQINEQTEHVEDLEEKLQTLV